MMNKIMEEQIMLHKFHEFLYGYNTEERTIFFKEMEKDILWSVFIHESSLS